MGLPRWGSLVVRERASAWRAASLALRLGAEACRRLGLARPLLRVARDGRHPFAWRGAVLGGWVRRACVGVEPTEHPSRRRPRGPNRRRDRPYRPRHGRAEDRTPCLLSLRLTVALTRSTRSRLTRH